MRFVPWYALADAAERAPASPGMFQVRVRAGLIDYPRGKSAMIHYGFGEDVRAAAAAFSAAHPGVDWLCRHAEDISPREIGDPEALCRRYIEQFRARFGAPPTLPG